MSPSGKGNGAAFAYIHDLCRAKKIPFDHTAVEEGEPNAPVWTGSVILRNDEKQRYVAQGLSKRAALSAAAHKAMKAEGIVYSGSSENGN